MAEPILWANKAKRMRVQVAKQYNPKTKELEVIVDDDTGEPVMEKIPQRGHVGERFMSENPKIRNSQRWVHWLKHCGNEARVPVTNAAAQIDPDTKFKQFITTKSKHFGWIPVGHCPIALIFAGGLRRNQLADKELKKALEDEKVSPCQHGSYGERMPCKHYIAEREARRLRKKKLQTKRDKQFQGDAEKAMEAQREAQREQTSAIAELVAKTVAEQVGGSK